MALPEKFVPKKEPEKTIVTTQKTSEIKRSEAQFANEAVPPVVQTFSVAREIFDKSLNKQEIYREMTNLDYELYGAIRAFSYSVAQAYNGIFMEVGEAVTPEEAKILEDAKKWAEQVKLRRQFYNASKISMRHGDAILLKIKNEGGDILGYSPLPNTYTTIVQSEEQIGSWTAQIFGRGIYLLNELSLQNTVTPLSELPDTVKAFQPEDILHISLESEGEEVYDLLGRFTYGVYSEPPSVSLKTVIWWKQSMILDDIAWRHANVPRQDHELDLSAFKPEAFNGATIEDRIAAAKAAAEAQVEDYASKVGEATKDVDKHYIHGQGVKIKYLEPSSTTYRDPNDLVEQQNRAISVATGVPKSALAGSVKSSFASELIVADYAAIRARLVAQDIAEAFEKDMKSQMIAEGHQQDAVDKLYIGLQFILEKDRTAAARQTALLRATGIFTRSELREMYGYTPLTTEQLKELPQPNIGTNVRTPAQVTTGEVATNQPGHPSTPQSKIQRQVTLEEETKAALELDNAFAGQS